MMPARDYFWKLGVVKDVITGGDQQVRAAVVNVSDPRDTRVCSEVYDISI